MARRDVRFPFQIEPGAGRAAEEEYERHVAQMVRQVLFTAPGERVNLPEFGCGLRQLIFAPNSDALRTTTEFLVFQALERWLAGTITVRKVSVEAEEEKLLITVDYVVQRTQRGQQAALTVTA